MFIYPYKLCVFTRFLWKIMCFCSQKLWHKFLFCSMFMHHLVLLDFRSHNLYYTNIEAKQNLLHIFLKLKNVFLAKQTTLVKQKMCKILYIFFVNTSKFKHWVLHFFFFYQDLISWFRLIREDNRVILPDMLSSES